MSSADRGRDQPRAMIHRRILDVAASDPEASLEAIADEVSGASPTLVERVLDEYGDPGHETDPAEGHGDAIGDSDSDGATGHVTADGASGDAGDFDDTPAATDCSPATTDDTAMNDTATNDPSTNDPSASADIATGDDAETATPDSASTDGAVAGEATTVDAATTQGDTGLDDTATTGGVDDREPATNDDASTTGGDTATTDDTATPGDTAASDDDAATADDDSDDSEVPPEIRSLSEKQRRTLRALYERPDASQGDLAEELDVTRATVCRRLNAIPGFEWSDRRAFAESVFGDDEQTASGGDQSTAEIGERSVQTADDTPTESEDSDDSTDCDAESTPTRAGVRRESGSDADGSDAGNEDAAPPGATERRLAAVEDRLASIESRLDDTGAEAGAALSVSPALAHKVVHACLESDRLTEDEELEVLRSLME